MNGVGAKKSCPNSGVTKDDGKVSFDHFDNMQYRDKMDLGKWRATVESSLFSRIQMKPTD